MSWSQKTTSWPIAAAAPADVYDALIDSGRLCQWFTEHATVNAREGGAFHFWGRHTPGLPARSDATQLITSLTVNEQLAFTWHLMGVDSTVSLSIAPHEQGATITAEHQFASALGIERQREFIDDFWRLSFANLTMHLTGVNGLTRPDYADPAPAVEQEVLIAAPGEVVWDVLLKPELINQWSGSKRAAVDVAARTYQLGWQYKHDGKDVQGGPTQILAIEPNRKLELNWPDWRGDASVTGQRIVFALSDSGGGTRLKFTHNGFARAADISDYGYGWIHFLSEIKRVATETHSARHTP